MLNSWDIENLDKNYSNFFLNFRGKLVLNYSKYFEFFEYFIESKWSF